MRVKKQSYITAEEYLKFERKSQIRHEYVNGCVYAMTGGVRRHGIICSNLNDMLRQHVRGSGCRVFVEILKARVEATNCYYYPDLLVACGPRDLNGDIEYEPLLLVEVLSRSTSTTDRREKVCAYRLIPTLKEYLIVHQRRRCLELHRRNDNGQWDVYKFLPGDEVVLKSIPAGPLKLSFDAIYDDTDAVDSDVVREETSEYDVIDYENDW